jgi:membrane dipeptidase
LLRRRTAIAALAALACAREEPASPDPARALHENAIVIDGHSDVTPWLEDPEWSFLERHADGHEDLPRMREGGLDAQFFSIWLPKTEGRGRAIATAIARIDAVHELVRRNPGDLALATTAADVRRAASEGKVACLLGMEGGHIIEDSLAALRTYHRLGVRYLTLTHSFHTSFADSSGTNETLAPLHGGLTPFGEEVVRESNRLGVLVDVSHVSDATFFDALRVTSAPVIASHSSVRAVADHPRNLSDDMLRALAGNGGVVMINFYSGYVDAELVAPLRELFAKLAPRIAAMREERADDPVAVLRGYRVLLRGEAIPATRLEVLLDHFDHALAVAGADHVGIGGDWDGVASMPRGLEDVSKLPALTRGLLERGHPPEVVRKVLGENLLRVLRAAEVEAERAAAGGTAPAPREAT